MDNELLRILEDYVEKVGIEKAKDSLESLLPKDLDDRTLTIIANSGIHEIPKHYLRGEVYAASSGSIDFTSIETLHLAYRTILEKLLQKLKERQWTKVYLIPTGHCTLALQIKLFVYHILRIDTIDLFYNKGNYFEIAIDHRKVATNSDHS